MKNILCFGDSNTWGLNPMDGSRYDRPLRWPGALASLLGKWHHVIEEGLSGRTTLRDDPLEAHKNGLKYLLPCLASHQPLDLVVLMLGTNDLKHQFVLTPGAVAEGVGTLLKAIQTSTSGVGGAAPQVLLLAPPYVSGLTALAEMFAGAEEKSLALAPLYAALAQDMRCFFLDAGPLAPVSPLAVVPLSAGTERLAPIRFRPPLPCRAARLQCPYKRPLPLPR